MEQQYQRRERLGVSFVGRTHGPLHQIKILTKILYDPGGGGAEENVCNEFLQKNFKREAGSPGPRPL